MHNVRYLPTKRRMGKNYILSYSEIRALGNTRFVSFFFSRSLIMMLFLAWSSVFIITYIGIILISYVVDFDSIAYKAFN